MILKNLFLLTVIVAVVTGLNLEPSCAKSVWNHKNDGVHVARLNASQDENTLKRKLYGTLAGRVTCQETGSGIPDVDVQILGSDHTIFEVKTDWDGRYSYDIPEPGEYLIKFVPKHPYCIDNENKEVYIETGKTVVVNKKLELGGSITGRILLKDKGINPFNGVRVSIINWKTYEDIIEKGEIITHRLCGSSIEFTDTNSDGDYFLGSLFPCPNDGYCITASCSIPGQANKFLVGITVKKGKNTEVEDIIFDFTDITGIDGYVTSSFDGGYLENASIFFDAENQIEKIVYPIDIGSIKTDGNGYFYLKNLEPGNYSITILPPTPPKIDEKTGKPYYTMDKIYYLKQHKKVLIERRGEIKRINIMFDFPSGSK